MGHGIRHKGVQRNFLHQVALSPHVSIYQQMETKPSLNHQSPNASLNRLRKCIFRRTFLLFSIFNFKAIDPTSGRLCQQCSTDVTQERQEISSKYSNCCSLDIQRHFMAICVHFEKSSSKISLVG
jgi:hypothetical protein